MILSPLVFSCSQLKLTVVTQWFWRVSPSLTFSFISSVEGQRGKTLLFEPAALSANTANATEDRMKKKRSRAELAIDEEEEYRRISTRKRRSVQYNEDGDAGGDVEEEDEDEDEEEEDEEEEDSEQPGSSTQDAHTQTTQENRFLTVTCGNKKGVLDKEKLKRGEECIKCDSGWYSPPAFENFGGKGSSRKWKQTILHKNEPLQSLFEKGVLTTKGFKSRRAEPEKRKKIPSSNRIISLDSSSEDSEIQTVEESDEEAVEDEDWLPSSEDLVLEAEEERVEAENGREAVDSEVDTSKEEDEMEEGEMEDEDVHSGGANDSSVSEETEPKGIFSMPEKCALQMNVKVVIKKLTEFQAMTDYQSNHKEPPLEDSWCQPLDEDAQNEEDGQHNGSGTDETAAADADPSEMSDPPDAEGVKGENGVVGDMKDVGPATKSKRVLDERKYPNRDATTSRQKAADLQVTQLNTRIPRTTQASNITQSSKTVETPSYRPAANCDLDTMDLDQLRREKLKMQIKVLRLQEEYYTLKIKGHKKVN